MIFKAKFETFDIKITFKGLYPSNLLCPVCNVVNEEFSHMFNCEFGPVCPASVRGLTLEHLHDIKSAKRTVIQDNRDIQYTRDTHQIIFT